MNKLQGLLHTLYQDAFGRMQIPQKRKLPNGLHLALTCHAKGVTLKICRDKTYPSANEWETVLNNFPYFTGKPAPKRIIDSDKRYALVGELPSQLKFDI